jgi:hypothetical protein
VLITSFDAAKIQEGEAFHAELARSGFHLRKVIVNRAWPTWTPADATAQSRVRAALQGKGERALAALHDTLADYYRARRSLHTSFADLVTVPEIDDVAGLHGLERLAEHLVTAR